MGSVVMWPPPQGPGLSLRCLFRMAMRVTSTLRGAEGQGGQESPLPLLGQGPALRLMLPRGPRVPGRPCSLLDIYLAVQGSWNTEVLVHVSWLAPSPSALLPACRGQGRAILALPGCQEALHAHGLCPASPLPGSAQGPRTQTVSFPREQQGGRGLGEEQSPPARRPRLSPLTVSCLSRARPCSRAFSRALWGKESGGLGFVF